MSIRLEKNDEIQVSEAVRDNSVMSSAAVDLVNSVRFLTKTPAFIWSKIFYCLHLFPPRNCGVIGYFDSHSECFEPIFARAGIDE